MKPARKVKKTRILVADRESVFRLGLLKLFGLEDDLRIVAQADTSEQIVRLAKQFKPEVVLVQEEILAEPPGNLVQRVRSASGQCKFVITASSLGQELISRYLRAGVSTVVPRRANPSLFVDGVRGALKHNVSSIEAPEVETVETLEQPEEESTRPVDTLTQREKEVISYLVQGFGNREIAQHLSIAEQTVKNHLRAVFDKVGVSDRLELVLYAIHKRLELPPVELGN
jgi:two-component system nitrate/nitrite response regulator NarL